MTVRRLIIILLVLSGLLELLITGLVFFDPAREAAQFGIQVTPDTTFLGHVIGHFTFLYTLLIFWSAWQLARRHAHGVLGTRVCGAFWVVIGLSLAYETKLPVYIAMDSVRGALLLGLTLAL
jgi:hypothetical protein